MTTVPTWMRRALLATAVMNLLAAAAFLPSAAAVRALAELPENVHPVYLATISMFIVIFGIGYLWIAATGRADRLFLGLAGAGKITFFLIWLAGSRSTLAAGLSAAGGNDRRLASGA